MAGSRTRLLMACKSEPRECPTRAVMVSIDCERPTASALRVLRKASWRPGQRIAAAAIFTDQEDGGGKMAGRVGPSDGLGSTTVRMGTAADSDGLTFTTTRNAPRGDAGAPAGSLEVAFGRQKRQRLITRCALSVRGSESATVMRSTSVVLSLLGLSGGPTAQCTLDLLG